MPSPEKSGQDVIEASKPRVQAGMNERATTNIAEYMDGAESIANYCLTKREIDSRRSIHPGNTSTAVQGE